MELTGEVKILPSSFNLGPRFWHERYMDSLALSRHYGKYDLFITITCRSEEHTSELQSRRNLVCRLLLEKKKK